MRVVTVANSRFVVDPVSAEAFVVVRGTVTIGGILVNPRNYFGDSCDLPANR